MNLFTPNIHQSTLILVLSLTTYLIFNYLWLKKLTSRVTTSWRNQERESMRHWSREDFETVDMELKRSVRSQLQNRTLFFLLCLLSCMGQWYAIQHVQLLVSFVPWGILFIAQWMYIRHNTQKLFKDGLNGDVVITNEKLKMSLYKASGQKKTIYRPYSFIFHYLRFEELKVEQRDVLRSEKENPIVKAEYELLVEEEGFLNVEMYLMFTGNARHYNIEQSKEAVELMLQMRAYGKCSDLPIAIRMKAMENARKLQGRAGDSFIQQAILFRDEVEHSFYLKTSS